MIQHEHIKDLHCTKLVFSFDTGNLYTKMLQYGWWSSCHVTYFISVFSQYRSVKTLGSVCVYIVLRIQSL